MHNVCYMSIKFNLITDNPPSPDPQGCGAGCIAGVVVAAVVIILLIIVIVVVIAVKASKSTKNFV